MRLSAPHPGFSAAPCVWCWCWCWCVGGVVLVVLVVLGVGAEPLPGVADRIRAGACPCSCGARGARAVRRSWRACCWSSSRRRCDAIQMIRTRIQDRIRTMLGKRVPCAYSSTNQSAAVRCHSQMIIIVLGYWVGARRPFHLSLFLTASAWVLPQDPSTHAHAMQVESVFCDSWRCGRVQPEFFHVSSVRRATLKCQGSMPGHPYRGGEGT